MYKSKKLLQHISPVKGRRGHDRLVVGLKLHMQSVPITTNILHRRGLLDTTLSDKVSQGFVTDWWFSSPIKLTATI